MNMFKQLILNDVGLAQRIKLAGLGVAVLALSACGSDFNEVVSKAPMEVLQISEPVMVYDGDSLIDASADAEIDIVHNQATDLREVTLLSGTATLLRGEFVMSGGH